jgi:hypothetical protein
MKGSERPDRCNNSRVQSAFGTVVWVVCALGIVAAFLSLIGTRKAWDEYGKGRLVMDHENTVGPAAGSAAALVERDAEIREMLGARNARRARRGEPPIDVEAELKRLTATQIDAGLRAEIRDLVIARNARRARLGKPPLDVEAEIEREIAGLHDLGV